MIYYLRSYDDANNIPKPRSRKMSLKIPKNILAKTKEMTSDEANKIMATITSAIDDIYNEKATSMDYQKLYE